MVKDPTQGHFERGMVLRIQQARQRAGKTQQEVAVILGVETSRYSKWETRSPMPIYFLVRFCLALGVDIEWVVTGNRRPHSVRPLIARQPS